MEISLRFVPKGAVGNASLAQIIVWAWTGDKLLLDPMMIQFTDWFMIHQGPFSVSCSE